MPETIPHRLMRAGTETVANYRCETASVAGFIQQLAVGYVARGYWFYVTGFIPPHKDARAVDAKLIERYGIDCSKWARWRRKARGLSNAQYLRFRQFFVLLATPGEHEFFVQESKIEDIRRRPIQCFGYSIGCYHAKNGHCHPSIRIEQRLFRDLKEEFLAKATRETNETLHARFARLEFEPYSPVRRQVLELLRAVNRARKLAGLELVPWQIPKLKRTPVRPFGRPAQRF